MKKLLSAGDVAEIRGVSRRAAYKWIVALEKVHGAEIVVRRVGPNGRVRRLVSSAAMSVLLPRERHEAKTLRAEVVELRELQLRYATQLRDVEKDLESLRREFRAASAAWFRRGNQREPEGTPKQK